MVQTPIVKTAMLNGREVAIHACPWGLYRKLYASKEADSMEIVEEVVRACVLPVDGDAEGYDPVETSSRAQVSRLFELAVSDEDGAKPDF